MKLIYKLPVMVVLVSICTGIAISYMSMREAGDALINKSHRSLEDILSTRKHAIEGYFSSIQDDLVALSTNDMTKNAIEDFIDSWNKVEGEKSQTLQEAYITGNPYPTGEKDKLDYAEDGTAYSETHKKYHPWFRDYLQRQGYYDIFLFDTQGNLIYTVFKELDYALNFFSGKYKDTDLGNSFRAALSANSQEQQFFYDFKPYSPSHGAPASFMSQQVVRDGEVIGVLVFQMPIDKINEVAGSTLGLGETGEVFIIGQDLYMRSDARGAEETTILKKKIDLENTRKAIAGQSGSLDVIQEDGSEFFSAYAPFEFMGVQWAIIAWQANEEITAPVRKFEKTLIDTNFYVIIAMGILGLISTILLIYPLQPISRQLNLLLSGKTDFEVKYKRRSDEIGEFSRAIEEFKNIRLEAEARSKKLVDDFQSRAGNIIEALATESENLQRLSNGVSERVNEASEKSEVTSAASEETQRNVNTVNSNVQEMQSSIQEIAKKTAESALAVSDAVRYGGSVEQAVEALEKAAEKIADVVSIIRRIASETTVLSLNATIESAQAGEAGRGFAVVASEVKNLATQTASATSEIASQIDEVQKATEETVMEVKKIRAAISKVSEHADSINGAIEQQTHLTAQISDNMNSASTKSNEIHSNLGTVYSSTSEARDIATTMLKATTSLADQASRLQKDVGNFLDEVRLSK